MKNKRRPAHPWERLWHIEDKTESVLYDQYNPAEHTSLPVWIKFIVHAGTHLASLLEGPDKNTTHVLMDTENSHLYCRGAKLPSDLLII